MLSLGSTLTVVKEGADNREVEPDLLPSFDCTEPPDIVKDS